MLFSALPEAQGLYDPARESDSCGVAMVADIQGRRSHAIVADGLTALWRIYQTHGDLQRAFPPSQPGVGKNLLMFARNNALTGSQYEKDILGPHADLYVRLHDAK